MITAWGLALKKFSRHVGWFFIALGFEKSAPVRALNPPTLFSGHFTWRFSSLIASYTCMKGKGMCGMMALKRESTSLALRNLYRISSLMHASWHIMFSSSSCRSMSSRGGCSSRRPSLTWSDRLALMASIASLRYIQLQP